MENVQDIERLITEIEATADPATRTGVRQLVEAILEFHGSGLARMVELAGEGVVRSFARDDLASALLLLYGLHPESFEARGSAPSTGCRAWNWWGSWIPWCG